jgi:citrate synthase
MVMAGTAALASQHPKLLPWVQGDNIYFGESKRELIDNCLPLYWLETVSALAAAYCYRSGKELKDPNPELGFVENFLYMVGVVEEHTGLPNPRHVDILERLWILTLDHEMTCSTASVLHTASSLADPWSCFISGLCSTLGILHGGAIEAAHKNFESLKTPEDVEAKLANIKVKKERLIGYGHRVYKVEDPRYVFIKGFLEELKDEVDRDPILRIARQLDEAASTDPYFTSRQLKPNADLFSSFVYKAMYIPPLPLSLSFTQITKNITPVQNY